ncbi:MAG: hypothetical protein P1R58_03695 [bacterium]|nr:hypothetical protein [bacterium]
MNTKILTSLFLIATLILVVGCEREVKETIIVEDNTDCFECHGDNGFLLQAKGEWANSIHASGSSVDYTNRGGTDCTKCHNHQGFQEFLATGEVTAPYDSVSAIHCFTCHSPHLTGDMSLVTDAPVTLPDGTVYDFGNSNICANCHQSRETPADIVDGYVVTSSRFGPHHGPQSDLIAGTIGYEYAAYGAYPNSNHGGAVGTACVSCHMGNPSEVHEGYHVGGHSWNMEDEEGNTLVHYCATCHTEAGDRGDDYTDITQDAPVDYDNDGDDTEGYMNEMDGLHDSLGTLLLSLNLITGSGSSVADTNGIADGGVAGAVWNYRVYLEDRSHSVHNPAYIKALLESSIAHVDAWITANPAPPSGPTPIVVASH